MADSNRMRLASIREATLGVSPATMKLRTARITGESLKYSPRFFTPAELRADRMSADPAKINEENSGGVNFELHYPVETVEMSDWLQSAMLSTWINLPSRDNDGTADSVITDIGTVANTVTVTTGGAFVIGHLIRTTGFATAANNTVARVTTGGTTSVVATAAGYVAEAVPPAAARVKVVGVEGVAADITATASGLACTALNFLTAGIVAGMWIKVGGTAAANRFATAALNDWIRVVSVTATAIVADNLPAGWAVDSAAGKTIRLFFGDVIRNGTTLQSVELERAFLDQSAPTYIIQKGMCADQLALSFQTDAAITGSVSWMGMTGAQGTVANGTTYDPPSTSQVMTSNVSVGRIAVGGALATAPNWVRSLQLQVSNNLRMIPAIGSVGAVAIGAGEVGVTGTIETYFGSNALLAALMNGTISSLNVRAAANSQAIVLTLPRVTFTDGSANAGAKNQDVTLPLSLATSADPVTNCEIQFDRVEYFEV